MSDSLLPPNRTDLEHALERAATRGAPLNPAVQSLWNPYECPEAFLPWLAWAVGVEEWDVNWPAQIKRDVIAATPEIRRHRGTVWAVRSALRAAGYADAQLEEGMPILRHDGSGQHNGEDDYTGGGRWALFRVIADIGESQGVGGEELQRLVRLINRAKPVRSVLRGIAYRASVADSLDLTDEQRMTVGVRTQEVRPAGLRHDGSIRYNQATKLPRAQQLFDGSARHDGVTNHDGLKPFHEWLTHGARHDNVWDSVNTRVVFEAVDQMQVRGLRNGQAVYDGSLSHGANQPPMVDVGRLTAVRRQRRNGRILYDGRTQHTSTVRTNFTI